MTIKEVTFDKQHPFLASIKERSQLSKPGSKRKTYHLVLDLKGSGLKYEIGDSIGILPINDPELVKLTLKAMKASGSEMVTDKQGSFSCPLSEMLSSKTNLTEISRKFLSELSSRQPNAAKKEALQSLFTEENKNALRTYLENHQVWDALMENEEVSFTPQELIHLMMPILPRLYSIASSQKDVGDEVHLTISNLRYISNGHERFGVCTHYLCSLTPLSEPIIPVYIQPHHGFTLPPNDETDIIMIGPGTGVAPFRAFMQERRLRKASGKHWLFFGEWNRAHDFFYEDFWETLQKENLLKVSTAFSRDQEHKIYVQHRMLEQKEELYSWLEKGAFIYVCGNASRMAKDVESTLLQIISSCGNKNEQEAKEYLKKLRAEKKYLRDIY